MHMNLVDRRRLVFDEPLLQAAFEQQSSMLQRLGLASPPIMINVVPAKGTLEICVFDDQKGCISEVEFGGAALAALLMSFAQRNGVPLPRRSRKVLEFAAGCVALVFDTDVEIQAPSPLG